MLEILWPFNTVPLLFDFATQRLHIAPATIIATTAHDQNL